MKGKKGYTLVETMVAMLLVATITTSVFSLVLSAKVGAKQTTNRSIAHYHARQQAERLKAYVSADLTVNGPNANTWNFPNDASGLTALAPGTHDVTTALPAKLQALGWTMQYVVTNQTCGIMVCDTPGDESCCKAVNFTVGWDGP